MSFCLTDAEGVQIIESGPMPYLLAFGKDDATGEPFSVVGNQKSLLQVCMYVCICVHACMRVCVYVCTCACMYV